MCITYVSCKSPFFISSQTHTLNLNLCSRCKSRLQLTFDFNDVSRFTYINCRSRLLLAHLTGLTEH